MKKRRLAKVLGGLLLSMSLAIGVLGSAFAKEATYDPTKPVTLTVNSPEGECFVGVGFTLYRVADMAYANGEHSFTLSDGFEAHEDEIDLENDRTADNWAALALTLAGMAANDAAIKPFDEAKTG